MKVTLESQESDLNQTNTETSGSLIFHIQALGGNGDRDISSVDRNMRLTLPALLLLLYQIYEVLLKSLA